MAVRVDEILFDFLAFFPGLAPADREQLVYFTCMVHGVV